MSDDTDQVELVRCTRGHTVKRDDCDRYVGRHVQLFCPLCESRIETVKNGDDTCKYSAKVVCTDDVASSVANAWMVFCNAIREINGAEITDARADPEGVERVDRSVDTGDDQVAESNGDGTDE